MTNGPNEDPNPAHAYPTSPRIVSFCSQERMSAMTDMVSTESLPRKTSSLSEAERRKKVLYISSVKELAVTKSCEEIVLMMAASIAEIKKPVISGWNSISLTL